jgi:hypothetical protein
VPNKFISALTDDSELSGATLRLLSLLFLLLSGAMSLFKYTQITSWWWPDVVRTFKPSLISTVLAIFLIAPLYLRGILKWNKSIYSILSLVLILLVFSSFVELAMGGNQKSIFIYGLLGAAIILSWLGIREVASISWVLALCAGIYAAAESNLAMGIAGFVYIAAGFCGLVLHSGLHPGQLVQGLKSEFSKS